MQPLDLFANLLRQLDRARYPRAFERMYAAEIGRLYAARSPRKRKAPSLADMLEALGDEGAAVRSRYKAKASVIAAKIDAATERIRKQLDDMAQSLPLTIEAGESALHTATTTGYSSQGFGAGKYAMAEAQQYVRLAEKYNIPARIDTVNRSQWATDYVVMVPLSKVGCAILRRKPRETLREWLKASWKSGVNPRVMCPMLPHGLEEKLGLDYFGNDKG